MKWTNWEQFPIASIGQSIVIIIANFVDRNGCVTLVCDWSNKRYSTVTFGTPTHIRSLNEGVRFDIFSKHIPPELGHRSGLKVENYTFSQELETDDSYIEYFIHSDQNCPEFLTCTDPIIEKHETFHPSDWFKKFILPRLKSQKRVEHCQGLEFLYLLEGNGASFLVFSDAKNQLYCWSHFTNFQLTYHPFLTSSARSIANKKIDFSLTPTAQVFQITNSPLLRLTHELNVSTHRYDPSWASTLLRLDVVDFECCGDADIVPLSDQNLEIILKGQLATYLSD